MPVAYAEPENREEGEGKKETEKEERGRGGEGRGREREDTEERPERFSLQSRLMNEEAGSVSIACPRLLC